MDVPDFSSDWKKSVGFPINYKSDQSSEDEFDTKDVVMRHPHKHRSSGYLLADGGDGAIADLLGTTPPRARIRNKEKRSFRTNCDGEAIINRLLKSRRSANDVLIASQEKTPQSPEPPERLKKRASLKIIRTRERDIKMDLSNKGARDSRADSLPSPNPVDVPTLVESCNRFMSLTSKLKCKCPETTKSSADVSNNKKNEDDEKLETRVNFHNTFSMLIRMGNIDKSCRRAMSIEEQVWQNELKDLIWLELQAKLAGRSLAQQDAFLCAQRDIVPALVQNIIHYRFVNKSPCNGKSSQLFYNYESPDEMSSVSCDDSAKCDNFHEDSNVNSDSLGCMSFNCLPCVATIGSALREVGTLLDSFYNAEALYPSSKAMAAQHPLIATHLFNNRIKAMCLWYNVALHMRMRILALRRHMLAFLHRRACVAPSSPQSPPTPRQCMVKFDVNCKNSTDTNDSGGSSNSEPNLTPGDEQTVDQNGTRSPDRVDVQNKCQDNGVIESRNDQDSNVNSDSCDNSSNCNENSTTVKNKVGNGSNYKIEFDKTETTTPEITLSESQEASGTVDTTSSNESGYQTDKTSPGSSYPSSHDDYDVYDLGDLREIVMLKLLNNCEVSPYRPYHDEVLKTKGVRRSMMFINKMRQKILMKVYMTFERADSDQYDESPEPSEETKMDEISRNEHVKEAYELRRYGCWSEESLQMRLPSYRSHFLLLNTICMETLHDYLSLRLESQPAQPSCLTVKQLISELKEGIDIATEMRSAYVRNVDAALSGTRADSEVRKGLQRVLLTYDATLDNVVKQYLSYLSTMSAVELMSRPFLESEWGFSAKLAQRMRLAATLVPTSFTDIVCNQLSKLLNHFNDQFTSLMDYKENFPEDDDVEAKRHFVYSLCREAQNIYASEKEMTLQTVQFARLLAIRLTKSSDLFHCRERIFKSLMAIRESIVCHTNVIVKKTNLISWEEDRAESIAARIRELLLQLYKLGFELHKETYKFVYGTHRTEETQQEGARRRPASLQPRRFETPIPSNKRAETIYVSRHSFNPLVEANLFHKELHRFVNGNAVDRPRLHRLQASGVSPSKANRPRLLRSESIGGEEHDTGVFEDIYHTVTSIDHNVPELVYRAEPKTSIAHTPEPIDKKQAKSFPVQNSDEALWQVQVSRAIIDFAKCWMRFVMERCDRGRGLRPRWASQGLEFLMLACDPYNTKHLTEQEFEELKVVMDACISHVIGSRAPPPVATPPPRRPRLRVHSPATSNTSPLVPTPPAPPTPPIEPDPLINYNIHPDIAHQRRVLEAIRVLDRARDEALRAAGAVGRVLREAVASYEPRLRQVTFKWQRGLKIGAGTFGKVYTVVNTDSGQLLAMKQLAVGAGAPDRRALQRAANELQLLEGAIHPHLVRYYGCELHRDEMLLFMELCVEGSLEALVGSTGGLPETQVRRYTKQLLSAIQELHNRQIAHRDIKTGNIFLTNEGHCLKLGDFGCAVRIRANSTAAGELQGHVGTQAYMAPEVFMKSSGHGRAADIWSLGCVVTEMAAGKRPFIEYDSNYQIMFVVGMGGRPDVPEALSHEGRTFCYACLTHDPLERPKADALAPHPFLMVKSDEDCNCEPGFLITTKK